MVSATRLFASILVCASIAACTSTPPPPRPEPHLAFTTKPIIVAPAAQVSLLDQFTPAAPMDAVQGQDMKPAAIVQTWVDKRLRSNVMAHGKMAITVLEASVVQQALPMDTSLKARLTQRQAEYKLIGTLKWRLSYNGPLLASWSSEGTAQSTGTVLEESSPNDRDQAYADVIDGMAQSFDTRMEEQLSSLRTAQSDAADATGH
jgi:hypothetical protein